MAGASRAIEDHDSGLDLHRSRDLRGRSFDPWIRRGSLTLLAVVVVLALSGAFGQPTATLRSSGTAARLQVELPRTLRGGLMWRARIVVQAERALEHPRLILGAGFVHGMQLNTLEPSPQSEAGRRSQLVLSYAKLDAGDELVVYLQLQVNPTTVGGQDTSVELDDATAPVARIAHTTTVLP